MLWACLFLERNVRQHGKHVRTHLRQLLRSPHQTRPNFATVPSCRPRAFPHPPRSTQSAVPRSCDPMRVCAPQLCAPTPCSPSRHLESHTARTRARYAHRAVPVVRSCVRTLACAVHVAVVVRDVGRM